MHVGAPLGPRGLLRLRAAVDGGLDGSEAGERLAAARKRRVDELLLRSEAPLLGDDPGALLLLSALHDLLFLLHPAAEGALVARRLGRVSAHAARLAGAAVASLSDGAARLCARHSLLHGLFGLSRDDVRVTFWAGRREFHGMTPPPRLLAWPGLRRVQEERWRVICYLQLLGQEGGRAAFSALLAASPLSDLLSPKRLDPPLDLLRHAPLLSDLTLRRAVIAHYLGLGLAEVGGALGTALLRLLGRVAAAPSMGARADLAVVLRFLCELQLCVALGPDSDAPPPADGALRDLGGVFCALHQRWPFLALPPDVAQDRALSERARSHAEALGRAVGPGRLDELIGLCARALSAEGTIPPPPPPLLL